RKRSLGSRMWKAVILVLGPRNSRACTPPFISSTSTATRLAKLIQCAVNPFRRPVLHANSNWWSTAPQRVTPVKIALFGQANIGFFLGSVIGSARAWPSAMADFKTNRFSPPRSAWQSVKELEGIGMLVNFNNINQMG